MARAPTNLERELANKLSQAVMGAKRKYHRTSSFGRRALRSFGQEPPKLLRL